MLILIHSIVHSRFAAGAEGSGLACKPPRQIACLPGADDLPRVDLHAHIDGETPKDRSLTPAEATAISRKLGVRLGILIR